MLRLNETPQASFRLFLTHLTYRYRKIILHFCFILIGGKALADAVDKLRAVLSHFSVI
jgi:hypothetical protein